MTNSEVAHGPTSPQESLVHRMYDRVIGAAERVVDRAKQSIALRVGAVAAYGVLAMNTPAVEAATPEAAKQGVTPEDQALAVEVEVVANGDFWAVYGLREWVQPNQRLFA